MPPVRVRAHRWCAVWTPISKRINALKFWTLQCGYACTRCCGVSEHCEWHAVVSEGLLNVMILSRSGDDCKVSEWWGVVKDCGSVEKLVSKIAATHVADQKQASERQPQSTAASLPLLSNSHLHCLQCASANTCLHS